MRSAYQRKSVRSVSVLNRRESQDSGTANDERTTTGKSPKTL